MNLSSLKSLLSVLLLNWPIGIGLAILVFVRAGFFNAVLFVIAWLILDKVWDVLTGFLIAGAGAIGSNAQEELLMETSGVVPARMATAMIFDLAGTLALPWIIAGYFLKWDS